MKKEHIVLILLLINFVDCISQITKTKIPIIEQQNDSLTYDGTKNFLGKDVNKYIGEELYLKGKNESLRKNGYKGFLIDYNISENVSSNIYECCDGNNSKYLALADKYFKVLEVISHPDSEKFKNTRYEDLYSNIYFLKLEGKEKKEIVYFEYNSQYETSFPFIAVKYYNQLKESYLDKEYIVRGKWSSDTKDIKTGKIVSKLGDKWKCVDLTIEEKNYELALILENSQKEQIIANLFLINNKNFCFTKTEADNYQKKFGLKMWNEIVDGKVLIGMSDEMCNLSLGKPNTKNEIVSSGKLLEQWVYIDKSLLFENQILTSIQIHKN